tara:strand:- start:278 stop:778 length:501 start_codon:yes stop_codon:yes gene_type:complete
MGIGPIIVLGITLLFGVFMYFIVVRSNKKNKLLMDSLKEVDIPEKQIKEDEIKSNLSIEELEKKSTEKKKIKELEDKTWKQTRIGLFIFILPHVIFEQVLFELYGSFGSNVVMVPVVVNFYITRYFIKGLIFERSETKNILYGLGISIIVFSIRLLLGVLFSLSVS